MTYTANCPTCGKEIEVDKYDHMESCERANDEEREALPFYCVECNLSFTNE